MKQKKNCKLIIFYSFVFMFGVLNSVLGQQVITLTPKKERNQIIKNIKSGDSLNCHDLDFYSDSSDFAENVFYSLYSAQFNKCNFGYFCAYQSIIGFFKKNNIEIDSMSFKFAKKCLMKGVESEECNAQRAYAEILLEGKYVPKDSLLAKKLLAKGWGVSEEIIERQWEWERKKRNKGK